MTGRRPRPVPTAETRPFWDGLAAGQLLVRWCEACAVLLHPHWLRCPRCLGELAWRPVSGRGRVVSWTRVERAFVPGFEPPYVVGRVELVEDPAVVLDTELDVAADELTTGLPVEVCFPRHDGFVTHAFAAIDGATPPS